MKTLKMIEGLELSMDIKKTIKVIKRDGELQTMVRAAELARKCVSEIYITHVKGKEK